MPLEQVDARYPGIYREVAPSPDAAPPPPARIRFATGATMTPIGTDPDAELCHPPTEIVTKTLAAAELGFKLIDAVSRDDKITEAMRALRIEENGDELLAAVVKGQRSLAKLDAAIKAETARAYAVPPYDPSDAVSFLADQERRSHLKALDPKGKGALMNAMTRDEAGDVVLAIMRSPVKLDEGLTLVAKTAWERQFRAKDPATADRLDAWGRSYEWGLRRVTELGAVVNSALKPGPKRMERVINNIKDWK